MGRSIYVEALIHTDMERLWTHTQTPDLHVRWDLRFSTIQYLPRPDMSQPQQFLYSTRIGFGLTISGKGESVGSREGPEGQRTSALRFWSDDPRSLIREGSGYWQYVPVPEGVCFLTDYNYQTRFGAIGRWFDRMVFRPLLGWATAWSFDRLRLWLEKNMDPAVSLERSIVHAVARTTLAFIWIYQGIFPKLLFPDTGEIALVEHSRMLPGHELAIATLAGVGEILFGILLLWRWNSRRLLLLSIVLLAALGAAALLSEPAIFVAPFNPLTLSLAMAALSIVGLISAHNLPSARSCRRRRENSR